MKIIVASYLIVFLFAVQAFATTGSNSEKWALSGFYGMGSVNPSDINSVINSQNTTPKLNTLSSEYFYGGSLGVMVSSKIQLRAAFELQDTKNGVNTTSPFSASGAGLELLQNEIWGSLNYYFLNSPHAFGYFGAGAGYPTYSHVTETLATKTDFDAAMTLGYRGQIGVGLKLGTHISVFAEGAYEYLVSGDIKTSSGTILTTPSGAHAKMDLSGLRGLGGLAIMF